MSDDTDALTADDFATYFNDQVELVRQSTASTPLYDVPYKATPVLDQWTVVTVEEVEKLIGSALNKTCPLDPAPCCLRSWHCCLTDRLPVASFRQNLRKRLFARC